MLFLNLTCHSLIFNLSFLVASTFMEGYSLRGKRRRLLKVGPPDVEVKFIDSVIGKFFCLVLFLFN